MFKKISVVIATILSTIAFAGWALYMSIPNAIGGCFDSTRAIGVPFPFFTTSGYEQTCGEAFIPANFNVFAFMLDLLTIGTLIYWLFRLLKLVRK